MSTKHQTEEQQKTESGPGTGRRPLSRGANGSRRRALRKKRRPPGSLKGIVARLKSERVQIWLAQRPQWRLHLASRSLRRTYEYPSAEVAKAHVSYLTSLASSLHQPFEAKVDGAQLTLSLHVTSRDGQGDVIDKVLDFADKLS
ncbi:MAG TPA: hypothetical protein VF756_16455 [Thermoanaerobaculia bacterium]